MASIEQTSARNDYVHEPVPGHSRRTWWRIFSVWVGFIIVVGIMAIGGDMAAEMSLPELITAVLLGNFLLGLLAALSGYVGARSGKSFAQLCADVFPGSSVRLVLLYAPITLIAWYSIECAIFGSLIGQMFGLSPMVSRIAMAASAAVFCITTYVGFRGMQWLSVVLVPTVLVIGTYVFIYVTTTGAGSFGFGPTHITFDQGLGLAIGSWALGVVAAYPDLARFAKSPAIGAWMGFVGIFVFNSLNFFIGAAGAALSRQYVPALILLSAGLPVFAVIMAIGNVWTTNDANLYSASLGISRAFPIARRPAVLLSAALSVVLAFFNPAQFSIFFAFLGVLGTTAPALGGVVLGGYLIIQNGAKPVSAWPAWLGWCAGSAVSWFTTGVISVPAGFIIGFCVWYLLNAFANRWGTTTAHAK
jgi:cytosine permease